MTNRTMVRLRRHLYRTFSKYLNWRLVRSPWLLVRTCVPFGLCKYAIILLNCSALSIDIAFAKSGSANYRVGVTNAA